MNPNEKIHGFVVRYAEELPEIGATLYRMEYEKNGADLVWLDREDDNKTFAITFKTIPQDDTGVFHILEHSVLNGSQKYPVKEPFVELLKSSLQTFLNAMTFSDKTMYPVSSRNDQDFLNLMDVYMDAVLHPLSISDPHAFRQEGWHYEMDSPEGDLVCNGVVYNEMKGAYADPDRSLEYELYRLLFPDNCYSFESGGYPTSIPTLTYENYLASHKRFYHPSNSRIFLDGKVDLDAVLGKLDSFLCEYDHLDVDAAIPMQQPVHPEERVAEYEIDPDDAGENKVLMEKGWVIGTYQEQEKKLATSILTEVLAGSNEAPLKKALLENNLCEDVEFQVRDDIQQPYLLLEIRNTSQEKREQVWQVVQTVLEQQARDGLDRERLHAVLNNLEFSMREKDFGSAPKGLVYAILAQEAWLYGGDPAQGLCFDKAFQSLRDKIDSGWYEQFIRENLLENPHCAQVVLLPSKTLGEERQARESARLAAIKASWSREECEAVIADFERLRLRQNTPDTPEQLETLPHLSLRDLPETLAEEAPAEIRQVQGTTVLWEDLDTNGIDYLTLYFSLADIPQEQLSQISFLCRLLGQVGTEHYSALQLRSQIEGNLGRFSAAPTAFAKVGQTADCTPYLAVSVSALESKRGDALRLTREILLDTDFSDRKLIAQLLRQLRLNEEQSISMSGNAYAARRIGASFSAHGAVSEEFEGIARLRWLQQADKAFEGNGKALCAGLKALSEALFTRERLTVNLTGGWDAGWMEELLSAFPSASMGQPVSYKLNPVSREGFQIPAEVGFAARAANLNAVGGAYSGAARVAGQYLTYDFLWNAIRVKGGAYGIRLGILPEGSVRFASYRDPHSAQSLKTYMESGDVLRKLADSGTSIEKYIISTVGETQPVMTPRLKGLRAASDYFSGRNAEDRQRLYTEILHTTPEELRQFSYVLDDICAHSGICVIAGKAALEECGEQLDRIESIQ
ncbi:MAG: insulinase family protein [Oscillospiraceae bacterium]|nr:insulinase family protein [Oscillospiraceae bacterium]